MTERHLSWLQINPERARTAADFFESYADLVESDRNNILTQDLESYRTKLADSASSLRVAGQWAMLFDLNRASSLFVRAGHIWHGLGHSFGTFLLAVMEPSHVNPRELANEIDQLGQISGIESYNFNSGSSTGASLYPQQQVYLLLTAAGMAQRLSPRTNDTLRNISRRSLNRRGVVLVGALGTPIRVYWEIAQRLLLSSREDVQIARFVARQLSTMAINYSRTIELAMVNERLWFNAAAPVDVADVDIVGIAKLSAYRVGNSLMRQSLREVAEELSEIQRIPLEISIDMIGSDDATTMNE